MKRIYSWVNLNLWEFCEYKNKDIFRNLITRNILKLYSDIKDHLRISERQ